MLAYLAGVAAEAISATVARVLERAQRNEKDRRDFFRVGAQAVIGRNHADERRHVNLAGARHRALDTAQDVDTGGFDPDLFLRLAQGRIEQGFVDRVDPAAREGDLSAMALDVIGAPDVNHVQVAVELEDWHEHGCAARRAGAMARDPASGFETPAQAGEALIDRLPHTHVSVPLGREYDSAHER